MMLQKVLITGASGLLGSTLFRSLSGKYLVEGWALSNVSQNGNLKSVDLTNSEQLNRELARFRPDVIVHAAALTKVDDCESQRELAVSLNVNASENIAKFAQSSGAYLIHISTDAFYDGSIYGTHIESEELKPISWYATTKKMGEEKVLDTCPGAVVLRSNFFGWNQLNRLHSAEWMLKNLSAGAPMTLFTDVHFTPLLVNDYCYYLELLFSKKLTGIYNIGSADQVSKFEFGKIMAEEFGFAFSNVSKGKVEEAGLSAPRSKNMAMNIRKISIDLGATMPSVRDGIRKWKALYDNGYVASLKGLERFDLKEWKI